MANTAVIKQTCRPAVRVEAERLGRELERLVSVARKIPLRIINCRNGPESNEWAHGI
jgi:hypothetical protein